MREFRFHDPRRARYASLARETACTVVMLEACGMTEQANRHRECGALLRVMAMWFERGGAA